MRYVWFVLTVTVVATMFSSAAFAAVSTTPVSIVVEGLITEITVATPTSGTITIAPPPGPVGAPAKPPVTFNVNERTKLFKDGNACALSALAVGNACRALIVKNAEGGLVAQIVYAKTVVPPMKVDRGTIFDKAVVDGVRTFMLRIPATAAIPEIVRWFSVSDGPKIMVDGKPAGYDLLANGQLAEVGYVGPPPSPLPVTQPILATLVAAKNPPPPPPPPITHVIGRLISVDLANGIIVVNPRGTTAQAPFKITDATKIEKFGPVALPALVPAGVIERYLGDMVDVAVRLTPDASAVPPAAIGVLVLPEYVAGVITEIVIDPDGLTGTLVIRLKAAPGRVAPTERFRVVLGTRIVRNGAPATVLQLANGDFAGLKFFQFREAKVASLVEAKSSLPPAPL